MKGEIDRLIDEAVQRRFDGEVMKPLRAKRLRGAKPDHGVKNTQPNDGGERGEDEESRLLEQLLEEQHEHVDETGERNSQGKKKTEE